MYKGHDLRLKLQGRRQPGKVACTQVAPQGGEQPPGQGVTEGDPDQAPGEPHQGALGDQPSEQAAAGESDGAQEGKLGAPPHDGQGLGGKDQEAAGQ